MCVRGSVEAAVLTDQRELWASRVLRGVHACVRSERIARCRCLRVSYRCMCMAATGLTELVRPVGLT